MGENIDVGTSTDLDWVIYFAYTTLINIVALNLLISIISNTFDNVLMSFDATQCTTRASMLLEYGSLREKFDDSKNLKYLYIVNYAHEAIGEAGAGDEFTGRVRAITDKIGALNSKFDDQKDKVAAVQSDVTEIKDQLKLLI